VGLFEISVDLRKFRRRRHRQIVMNHEEDEDAFLYGGLSQPGATEATASQRAAALATDARDVEHVSEEGEVDDEDEDEDSVCPT